MKTTLRHFLSILTIASLPATAAEWKPIATKLLASEKPGYGGLCGMVVDHQSGDLFINLSDLGIYHSKDQGDSWKQATATPPKGRTESPGCWLLDPTGQSKRMLTALVYGAPIALSDNLGKSFRFLDKSSEHIDWCAIDWTKSEPGFVLALKHEQDGLLIASTDGGKVFREVGKGYVSGWVFNEQTAVVAKEKAEGSPEPTIQRSTDGGKTFQSCGAFEPVGSQSARALPKWHGDKLYWLTHQGLIVTRDTGATWKKVAEIRDSLYGPIFGKDAEHLFVLTSAGIVESTDAGKNWSEPIAAPAELKNLAGLTWLEYDPTHDVLYLMKMTSDLYCLKR